MLEEVRTTWDHAISMIGRVHKEFIDFCGLLPPIQPSNSDIWCLKIRGNKSFEEGMICDVKREKYKCEKR